MSDNTTNPFEGEQLPPADEPINPEPSVEVTREAYNADVAGDDVPTGSAKEVLDWVGEDRDRAQKALDAEGAKSAPRKGLTSDLEGLVGE